MKKIIGSILILSVMTFAQDITNKLGASGNYDVTDSDDNILLRIEGNGDVGIGATSPNANFQVNGTMRIIGAGVELTHAQTYTAVTDGFAYAIVNIDAPSSAGQNGGIIYGEINVAHLISGEANNISATIMCPVRKGKTWSAKVIGENTDIWVYWIPLGL